MNFLNWDNALRPLRLLFKSFRKVTLAFAVPLIGALASLVCYDGGVLARLSYDLPFVFPTRPAEPDVVMVYVDDKTLEGRRYEGLLDRRYLTQLLNLLTAERAKLVLFDFDLGTNNAPPGTNEAFASAIRRNGNVILGMRTTVEPGPGSAITTSHLPMRIFRDAALAWGSLNFPFYGEFGSRELESGNNFQTNATWLAANILRRRSGQPENTFAGERWLNPIGPTSAGITDVIYLHQLLVTNGYRSNYFRDKVVLVGPQSGARPVGAVTDQFTTPWTRWNGQPAMGVEIHATSLLNLWHGNYLQRVGLGSQVCLVAGLGMAMVAAAIWFRRKVALCVVLLLAVAVVVVSIEQQLSAGVWWNWAVPALIQMPLGLWAVWVISKPFRYHVFISYRNSRHAGKDKNGDPYPARLGADTEAEMLYTLLRERHRLEVFYDRRELGLRKEQQGTWDERALPFVAEADVFVLLLSEGALDDCLLKDGKENTSDPVRREIVAAVDSKTLPIPVRWFTFSEPKDLPATIIAAINFPRIDWVAGHATEVAEQIASMHRATT